MTLKVNSIMHTGKKTSIQNIIKWVNDTKKKKSNFCDTGVPEEEEKEVKAEKIFIEIMPEKLLHLTTNITYRFKKLSKFQIG